MEALLSRRRVEWEQAAVRHARAMPEPSVCGLLSCALPITCAGGGGASGPGLWHGGCGRRDGGAHSFP